MHYLSDLLGPSERELVRLWRAGSSVAGPEDWLAVVNEVAISIPGTLAYQAIHDRRMPDRFREVAPSFEALGWRALDAATATTELAQLLAVGLLVEDEIRGAEAAAAAATAFIAIFGEMGQFLTNVADLEAAALAARNTGEWATACPLTPAVAEAGIIGIGAGRVGVLWVTES